MLVIQAKICNAENEGETFMFTYTGVSKNFNVCSHEDIVALQKKETEQWQLLTLINTEQEKLATSVKAELLNMKDQEEIHVKYLVDVTALGFNLTSDVVSIKHQVTAVKKDLSESSQNLETTRENIKQELAIIQARQTNQINSLDALKDEGTKSNAEVNSIKLGVTAVNEKLKYMGNNITKM